MDIFDIPPPPPHLDNERALQSQSDGFDIAAIPPPPEAFAVSMADTVEAAEATTRRALATVAAANAADDKKALKVARADLKLAEATEKAEKRRAARSRNATSWLQRPRLPRPRRMPRP